MPSAGVWSVLKVKDFWPAHQVRIVWSTLQRKVMPDVSLFLQQVPRPSQQHHLRVIWTDSGPLHQTGPGCCHFLGKGEHTHAHAKTHIHTDTTHTHHGHASIHLLICYGVLHVMFVSECKE